MGCGDESPSGHRIDTPARMLYLCYIPPSLLATGRLAAIRSEAKTPGRGAASPALQMRAGWLLSRRSGSSPFWSRGPCCGACPGPGLRRLARWFRRASRRFGLPTTPLSGAFPFSSALCPRAPGPAPWTFLIN